MKGILVNRQLRDRGVGCRRCLPGGHRVYWAAGRVSLSLLAQLPPLAIGVLMVALPRATPGPLLLMVSMLFVVCLAPTVWDKDGSVANTRASPLSLVAGLGITTKIMLE